MFSYVFESEKYVFQVYCSINMVGICYCVNISTVTKNKQEPKLIY